jgi:hypothetical protein
LEQVPRNPETTAREIYQYCRRASREKSEFLNYLPSPKREAEWGGGAQQQKQKHAADAEAASAAAAVAARQGAFEIHKATPRGRLRNCDLVVF